MRTLIYGLYRPVAAIQSRQQSEEIQLTRILLAELAYQLRMLRRRGVIPTLASLATFLAAFVFSVVLSFADVGKGANVTPLVLGLLYGWLPMIVVFAIVDRNPISSVRSAYVFNTSELTVSANCSKGS